jgi:hypothetical protein
MKIAHNTRHESCATNQPDHLPADYLCQWLSCGIDFVWNRSRFGDECDSSATPAGNSSMACRRHGIRDAAGAGKFSK